MNLTSLPKIINWLTNERKMPGISFEMTISYARRSNGVEGADWEERVDFGRLRKERLACLQRKIKEHGLGSMLLYEPGNIRYATGTRFLRFFTATKWYRYALIPKEGTPVLFELAGTESKLRELYTPWVKIRPSIIWDYAESAQDSIIRRWSADIASVLKELGVEDEKVGLDRIDFAAYDGLKNARINVTDGRPALYDAKKIKTDDEKELIKTNAAILDSAYLKVKEMLRIPGVRECDIVSEASKLMFQRGVEDIEVMACASGSHTNPYLREFTDKIVRNGDLVIVDFNVAGQGGYYTDWGRCFVCGDRVSDRQRKLFQHGYEILHGGLEFIRAGVTTKEVIEKLPEHPDEKHSTLTLSQFGHGVGISFYEPPLISRGNSLEFPEKLEKGMSLSLETYVTDELEGARIEEQFFVTDNGIEVLSLVPNDERLLG